MTKTSKAYREIIFDLLSAIEREEQESIDRAADILARVVQADGLINVIGTGGHSNLAAEEVLWRAGGLAPVNPLLDAGTNLIHGAKRSNYIERSPGYAKGVLDSYEIKNGDVLIIVNAYGINAFTIDCALECRRRGVTSIGITSKSFADAVPEGTPSRHPSNQKLYELVDVFIDSHLPLGDSVVELDGLPQKMGPTSTYVNAFAINLLMIRTAEKLLELGIRPPVWTSANLPDGDRLNEQYEARYLPRVKHLR
ncbi:MAG TPA: SIS domain-containing protein [Bacillota bacterium]|nr:SIS domain-containing protein [Bacillota bacterium]